ncbi:hypothetical protein ABH931_003736 [Streptacidiphilus sp. MAP12-33]
MPEGVAQHRLPQSVRHVRRRFQHLGTGGLGPRGDGVHVVHVHVQHHVHRPAGRPEACLAVTEHQY